jgi:hypothetical protein
METIKEYRHVILLVFLVVICCVLVMIFLPRGGEEVAAPTPLSRIVLQPGELKQNTFEQKALSADCKKYLVLQTQPDLLGNSTIDCYQVKFVSRDDSTIVLNAIWAFNEPALAKLEMNSLFELTPNGGNIDTHIDPVPGVLGEESSASSGTITGGRSALYISNLYWRQGSAVVRLSVLNYQGPIDLNQMMVLARGIEARLAVR